MSGLGKALLGLGSVLVILGCAVLLADRIGLHLGRLPGDIVYRGRHGSFYLTIVTCLVISVLLSLMLSLLGESRP